MASTSCSRPSLPPLSLTLVTVIWRFVYVSLSMYILIEKNSQHAVLWLGLLDLSAAFGTVDHTVSLRRLQTSFGISGAPLDWFKSYLSARRQRVSIPGALSGSLLTGAFHKGPVLVSCYISSTRQSYLSSLNVAFQILTVMRMIHNYIFPSSLATCQVNKML